MASVAMMVGGDILNAATFTGGKSREIPLW